jgi:hypothetical protein
LVLLLVSGRHPARDSTWLTFGSGNASAPDLGATTVRVQRFDKGVGAGEAVRW